MVQARHIGAKLTAILLTLCLCIMGVPGAAFGEMGQAFAASSSSAAAETTSSEGDAPSVTTGDNYVTQLFLKWSTDYDGPGEFVGAGMPLESVDIETKGKLVQLNGYYLDATGTGQMLETANSSTDLGVIPLKWQSSDINVVTVSPAGLVTAVGNGTASVTCQVDPDQAQKYGSASITITFNVDGQEGEYVSSVVITDADGNPIDSTIVLKSDGATPVYYQLEAQVTWSDADGNVVRTETTKKGKGSLTCDYEWQTAGSIGAVAVNATTGRIASQEAGICQVLFSASGGKSGRAVTSEVYVKVDTGQTSYNPADHLTLEVIYEDYPDKVVNTKTYSVEELAAILPEYEYQYTIIGGKDGSSFATIRARGYLFKDVVALMGVKSEDIEQFRFGTADSYDSPVSYEYLFGHARYFWPDYDYGFTDCSQSNIVPPMLATANALRWNVSVVLPSVPLEENTRFRLVFGVSSTSDANTSKQVYYIDTIKIVLKGSPPEDPDPDPTPDPEPDPGGGGGSGGGTGGGTGSGSSSVGESSSGDVGVVAATTSAGGGNGGTSSGSEKEWRIYQMLSDSESNPGELDLDNPISPFALPVGIAVFVLGAATMVVGFRRRLYS